MNKMEVLKNALEQVGYDIEISYDKELERYQLWINDDINNYENEICFDFDKNYEPLVCNPKPPFDKMITLKEYKKLIDNN